MGSDSFTFIGENSVVIPGLVLDRWKSMLSLVRFPDLIVVGLYSKIAIV